MLIADAQREVRTAFFGGFVGQLVAGLIWGLSAAISTWVAPTYGMAALFFISMLLFPLTQLILRLTGRPAKLSVDNTFGQLAAQIAFTVPLGFIVVAAATLFRQNWFYPASMVVVGAHYLPFIFLYGMKQYGVLAAILVAGGVVLGLYGPDFFSPGAWCGAVVLIAFAFLERSFILKEERQTPGADPHA